MSLFTTFYNLLTTFWKKVGPKFNPNEVRVRHMISQPFQKRFKRSRLDQKNNFFQKRFKRSRLGQNLCGVRAIR